MFLRLVSRGTASDPVFAVSLYCLHFYRRIVCILPCLWETGAWSGIAWAHDYGDKWRLFGAANKDATIPYDFPSRCRLPRRDNLSLDLEDYR